DRRHPPAEHPREDRARRDHARGRDPPLRAGHGAARAVPRFRAAHLDLPGAAPGAEDAPGVWLGLDGGPLGGREARGQDRARRRGREGRPRGAPLLSPRRADGRVTSTGRPFAIESPSGLRVFVNANGSIRRIERGDVVVNLFPGSEMEGGPANVYLRRRDRTIASIPILGPQSPARFQLDPGRLVAQGEWRGMRFTAALVLAR